MVGGLRSEQANSWYQRWVTMWATGVRASGLPMAVGDPATGSFIALSPAAVRLMGDATNYLDVVEPQDASEAMLRLMRGGLIDGARTRRRLRCANGSLLDVQAVGAVVRSPDGPDLGLGFWMPDPVTSGNDNQPEEVFTLALPRQDHARPPGDRLLLDESWRIREIQAGGDPILGWTREELMESSMLERTHPDDVPSLLFALARATSEPSARAPVRPPPRRHLARRGNRAHDRH